MLNKIQLWRRRLIARQAGFSPPTYGVAIRKDVEIPMCDGIVLGANLYLPKEEGIYPTILIRSPWGRGWSKAPFSLLYDYVAQRFAERGYIVVLQDVRNHTQISPSQIVPHENECQDGIDTLTWIAQQPWFNGKLGLWGASYLGYVQWAVLTSSLPQIETLALIPVTTSAQWFTLFHSDGALALDTLFRLQYTSAVTRFSFLGMSRALLKQKQILSEAFAKLPLTESIRMLPPVPGFNFAVVMQKESSTDPLWQKINLRNQITVNNAHIHLVAGWYDIFLREQLIDYQLLRERGQSPHLTIGPWHHTDQSLGAQSIRIALTWFDGHLKGDKTGIPSQPVNLFVLGANHWQSLDSWPPATIPVTYYLQKNGRLAIRPATDKDSFDAYHYDPGQPTPTIGGAVLTEQAGQQDNRAIEARQDVLTYTSEILQQDLTIMGVPIVSFLADSTLGHIDYFVRICDVQADGRSLNVTDGFMRLALANEEIGHPHEIRIELWPAAYCFAQGHQLRLQISSGAHPHWNRNLGTGESVATGVQMRSVEHRVYHNFGSPSQLCLPMYQG